MSRLVAKLMLALLMLPSAAAIYFLGVIIGWEVFGWRMEDGVFAVVSGLVLLYIAAYWLWLWRSTVAWSKHRIAWTIGVSIATITGGLIVAGVTTRFTHQPSLGIFIGTIVVAIVWLLMTVLIWRETNEERQARLRSFGGGTIVCANCGYNLTGLKRTLCPECGAEPTVEELLASQPSRADDELTAASG